MTETFVKTADILPLAKGNEITILNGSGISWKAGQGGHIQCPYPQHGGSADWRFDARSGMCHCTCNSRHSVFDALSLRRGDDPKSPAAFEQSKIEAAQILGRTDLIKTRRDSSSPTTAPKSITPPPWHGRFDAKKLLNPPQQMRNDDLYFDYMSERLGIPRDDVPVPSTPFVGISGLEYFDATDKGSDRRKPLCVLPCVVLGMVGIDGQLTGAIRIYLDPNGKEKAKLGLDASGNERRVKPFAPGTQAKGEVQFGDPATATIKIPCEGSETGAAIAYAAKKRGDNRILIACGGTANFMEEINRQPQILRMIAAADRDEKPKDPTKPPSKRGEAAGTRLLMRHHEDVSTSLALPGRIGEGVDWLDILRRDGYSAVYDGIMNAPTFEPSEDGEVPETPEPEEESRGPRMLSLGSDVEIARLALGELEERYGRVVFAEGYFWRHDKTHWNPFSESSLRLHIHTFDGSTFMSTKGASVIKLSKPKIDSILHEMTPVGGRDGNADTFAETISGINCRNGFIRFDAEGKPTLVPHSPEHGCRHVIGADWSGNSVDEERMKGSLLSKLLVGCFKHDSDAEDKIKLIGEVMGAAALGMATRIQSPKALVLLGPSAQNGKSQILDIMRGLLPPTAVSSIPAGKMGDEKHLVQLVGKLLNMSDELSSAESIAGDTFKKVITGNDLEARDVFKSAINFRPKAQHVFATNALPSFKGGIDRGVRRRLMVLEFNRTIPPSERIAEIGQLIATQELDLLLDFSVEGAARLIRQGKFSELASSDESVRHWVLHTDPVEAWLEESVMFVAGTNPPEVSSRSAYEAFRQWCSECGYTLVPSINKFSERVLTSGKGYGKKRDSSGRYFTGMAFVSREDAGRFKSFGCPR